MSLRQRLSSAPDPPPSATNLPSSNPQTALSQALQTSAHLANLLPTGTLLAFQLLTPVFTNNGSCDTVTQPLTIALLLPLSISCFLASLTDSIKAPDGRVYYGIATWKGLWLFDCPQPPMPEADLTKYKLSILDFVHALLSVLVFCTVASRDKNVVSCFYPKPGQGAQEVLDIVPVGIGTLCSLLFVAFPTRRHGIGCPQLE